MIIDRILDRKDGESYSAREFYSDLLSYGDINISRAMDSGTETDVKNALCKYIEENDYNKDICTYINSVEWL